MLQDAIWANTEKLERDQEYCDDAVRFVAASLQGWAYCRDNPDDVRPVRARRPARSSGESHQAWQMNEINKLIWPSPEDGRRHRRAGAWDRTVEISLKTKNADGVDGHHRAARRPARPPATSTPPR